MLKVIYSGTEAASYLSGGASVQGNGGAGGTLGTAGNFSGTASEILLFSGQSIPNRVPVADAGTDQNVFSEAMVTLDGSGSSGLDNDSLTYLWTQVGSTPPISLTGADTAMPTFTAPIVAPADSPVILMFQLIVNDGSEPSDPDIVTITVNPPGNIVPVANAGTDQTVLPGATVTLDGSDSTDAEDDGLTYEWRQISGPSSGIVLSDATAEMPTFTAPTLSIGASNVVLTFGLIVDDTFNKSIEDEVVITITAPVNTKPVADAGMDQSVSSEAMVTLNGSGSSDAEDDDLMYEWTQVGSTLLLTLTGSDNSYTYV